MRLKTTSSVSCMDGLITSMSSILHSKWINRMISQQSWLMLIEEPYVLLMIVAHETKLPKQNSGLAYSKLSAEDMHLYFSITWSEHFCCCRKKLFLHLLILQYYICMSWLYLIVICRMLMLVFSSTGDSTWQATSSFRVILKRWRKAVKSFMGLFLKVATWRQDPGKDLPVEQTLEFQE